MIKNKNFKATVIGAGPSGIAIMGQLLSKKIFPILWLDPFFEGGKMAFYRKVPANTRAKFFVNFMKECPAYDKFINQNNKNNPMDIFDNLDLNIPPSLSKAYDMCNSLTKNIEDSYEKDVNMQRDFVEKLIFAENENWKISTNSGLHYNTEKIILAIGSQPKKFDGFNDKIQIPLEMLVNDDPEKLQKFVEKNDTIGVIGSSHSSILSLKHLEKLPNPPKKIHCFYREKIRYAVHSDEGIIFDNIGLKGLAAEWARDYLEKGKSEIIEMHFMDTPEKEKEIYEKYLGECTKIAPMIGWERNSLPILVQSKGIEREINDIDYNGVNLRLIDGESKKYLNNIWGIGIAFPRHVKDLSGIMGMDVGIYKFGKAAKIIEEQITQSKNI